MTRKESQFPIKAGKAELGATVGVEQVNQDGYEMNTEKEILDYLHKTLFYDSVSGIFVRKVNAGKQKKNQIAGQLRRDGYIYIGYKSRKTSAQRLAWVMTYGCWPKGHIDHINGIKTDNRLCNLRDVTLSENQQNRFGPQKNNKSGFLGVGLYKNGKFVASLRVNGKRVYKKAFKTAEEAYIAYLKAKKIHHPIAEIYKELDLLEQEAPSWT